MIMVVARCRGRISIDLLHPEGGVDVVVTPLRERLGETLCGTRRKVVPTATVHRTSMQATCNQSLTNAAPSIVHIAQRAMATHTKCRIPTGVASVAAIELVDVVL
jgi:hypothetical protein